MVAVDGFPLLDELLPEHRAMLFDRFLDLPSTLLLAMTSRKYKYLASQFVERKDLQIKLAEAIGFGGYNAILDFFSTKWTLELKTVFLAAASAGKFEEIIRRFSLRRSSSTGSILRYKDHYMTVSNMEVSDAIGRCPTVSPKYLSLWTHLFPTIALDYTRIITTCALVGNHAFFWYYPEIFTRANVNKRAILEAALTQGEIEISHILIKKIWKEFIPDLDQLLSTVLNIFKRVSYNDRRGGSEAKDPFCCLVKFLSEDLKINFDIERAYRRAWIIGSIKTIEFLETAYESSTPLFKEVRETQLRPFSWPLFFPSDVTEIVDSLLKEKQMHRLSFLISNWNESNNSLIISSWISLSEFLIGLPFEKEPVEPSPAEVLLPLLDCFRHLYEIAEKANLFNQLKSNQLLEKKVMKLMHMHGQRAVTIRSEWLSIVSFLFRKGYDLVSPFLEFIIIHLRNSDALMSFLGETVAKLAEKEASMKLDGYFLYRAATHRPLGECLQVFSIFAKYFRFRFSGKAVVSLKNDLKARKISQETSNAICNYVVTEIMQWI